MFVFENVSALISGKIPFFLQKVVCITVGERSVRLIAAQDRPNLPILLKNGVKVSWPWRRFR